MFLYFGKKVIRGEGTMSTSLMDEAKKIVLITFIGLSLIGGLYLYGIYRISSEANAQPEMVSTIICIEEDGGHLIIKSTIPMVYGKQEGKQITVNASLSDALHIIGNLGFKDSGGVIHTVKEIKEEMTCKNGVIYSLTLS